MDVDYSQAARWGLLDFIKSCSSPPSSPPPLLPPLPCSLPPCQLFAKLFANFRTQWAPLDLTWDCPSSVSTAGPKRPDRMPDSLSEDMPEDMPDRVPEDMPEHISEDMPDKMAEDMPDREPEDLPVTKRIDVMVGITRSKVIRDLMDIIRDLMGICRVFLGNSWGVSSSSGFKHPRVGFHVM